MRSQCWDHSLLHLSCYRECKKSQLLQIKQKVGKSLAQKLHSINSWRSLSEIKNFFLGGFESPFPSSNHGSSLGINSNGTQQFRSLLFQICSRSGWRNEVTYGQPEFLKKGEQGINLCSCFLLHPEHVLANNVPDLRSLQQRDFISFIELLYRDHFAKGSGKPTLGTCKLMQLLWLDSL